MYHLGAFVGGCLLAGFAACERVNHPLLWLVYSLGYGFVVYVALSVAWQDRDTPERAGNRRPAWAAGFTLLLIGLAWACWHDTFGGPPHPWWFYGGIVAGGMLLAELNHRQRVVLRFNPARTRFWLGLGGAFGEGLLRGTLR